jgi:hypothetical protein
LKTQPAEAATAGCMVIQRLRASGNCNCAALSAICGIPELKVCAGKLEKAAQGVMSNE